MTINYHALESNGDALASYLRRESERGRMSKTRARRFFVLLNRYANLLGRHGAWQNVRREIDAFGHGHTAKEIQERNAVGTVTT